MPHGRHTCASGYPVRRGSSIPSLAPWNTGSSAFADDDGYECRRSCTNKRRLKSRPPMLNESRSHAQRTRLRGGISLGHLAPVHRIPPRLEVIGPAVLVMEIIGVFPDVIAE